MSSMGAHMATPGLALLEATKWDIEDVVESCRSEVERSTLIEPGHIPTTFYNAGTRPRISTSTFGS